ncbi:hypothetical protein BH09VER1_BH09VER1_16360 [soil metagenome]
MHFPSKISRPPVANFQKTAKNCVTALSKTTLTRLTNISPIPLTLNALPNATLHATTQNPPQKRPLHHHQNPTKLIHPDRPPRTPNQPSLPRSEFESLASGQE